MKLKSLLLIIGGLIVLISSFWGTLYLIDQPKAPAKYTSIAGTDWCIIDGSGRAIGLGRITQSADKIIFFNEHKTSSNGHFEDTNTAVADDWGGLRGRFNADRSVLAWENNWSWIRGQKCN